MPAPLAAAPRPIRLGVIGTGLAVEKLHWPALRQMPERYRIVAFANHSRPKAEAFAAYSGASMDDYHADYHDLLARDDVEAVLISLPIPLNLPVTREGLAAGKHVICEKPAGANLQEGREYVALPARHPDRVVLVAENYFYRDDLRLARSLLDDGAIGRLHAMAWRRGGQLVPRAGEFSSTPWRIQPDYVGGPHLDGGVHQIAQIRLLCGEVQSVYGAAADANARMGGPSDLALTLHLAGGAIGSFTSINAAIPLPPDDDTMRLYGEAGTMLVAFNAVSVHRPDGTIEEHRVEGNDGGYYNEFLDFYDGVIHGTPIVGTAAQAYQTMRVVLEGLESADDGRARSLAADEAGLERPGVPLWRPRGAEGLFDGLPARVSSESRRA